MKYIPPNTTNSLRFPLTLICSVDSRGSRIGVQQHKRQARLASKMERTSFTCVDVIVYQISYYLECRQYREREMVLKGLVVFIVIVAVAFSGEGNSGTSGTEAELYLIVPNSDVIINPGSEEVLTVIPRYLDSSYQPVENPVKKNVSVTFTLSDPGERPLCLSKEGDKGTDSDCSSCSVTIQGTESFSLVISYSPQKNEAFIEKDKVFHLDVSNDHIPTVKLQGGITITTRDSRSKYLTLLNKDTCMVCSNLFPVSAPHTICRALVRYGAWLNELT